MASATLTVKNRSNVDVVYTLASGAINASEYLWRNTALSLQQPCILTMKQELKRPGQAGSNKSYVALKRTTLDPLGDAKPHSFGVSILITDDPMTTLTEVDKLDLVIQARNLLDELRVAMLLEGVIS